MNHLNYDGGTGELKNWLIQESTFDSRFLGKCEAIFAQGNGYMGVRNTLEEAYTGEVRNTFVAGTFNKASDEEVTELPNVPDMTGMTILIDGHRFNLLQGELKEYTRTMNLKNGETIREIKWKSPAGICMTAVFKRIVSLADEHMLAAALDLTVDRDAQIIIETGIDGSVTNSGAQHFKDLRRRVYDGRDMQYLSRTTESDVWIAQHAACNLNLKADILPVMGRRTLKNRYTFMAKAGQNIHFEKISAIHSSRDLEYENIQTEGIEERLMTDGLKALQRGCSAGYYGLRGASALQWEKYWQESGITIDGDADFEQLAVRFSLYHLNIMAKQDDSRVGIGAKALTGEGYKGHSFWDTELFILPYFTFTRPDAAKTLLEYRYKNLLGARRKAKENGYEGAMYPWECAWVDDGEATPLYKGADVVTGKVKKVLTGLIEHHISADIAYAVWQYYLVTGDHGFMENCGYEMILDTALFWACRVQYREEKGRYEILDVIGPDEYKEHVDNNAYTNYMANYNMHLALFIMENILGENTELFKKLDQKLNLSHIKEKIDSCIDRLYLPGPDETGIIPQTDQYLQLTKMDLTKYKNSEEAKIIYRDFNAEQINGFMISKQADTVMLMFLFPDLFDEDIRRKNFTFYEDKTLHDSSLSKCIHSIMANDLNIKDMAYDFYKKSLMIDLGPQMKSSDEGIHSAAIGGIWESTVMGFGGVRMKGEDMHIAPRLPQKWNKLVFPLCVKGCQLKITASHDDLSVENMGQRESVLVLNGKRVLIEPGTVVRIEIKE